MESHPEVGEQATRQDDGRREPWHVEQAILRLGRMRDGLLTLAIVLYALGLITWWAYFTSIGIEFSRLFDAQYLVSGIPPFLILALCATIVRLVYIKYSRLNDNSRRIFRKKYKRISIIAFFTFLLGVLIIGFSHKGYLGRDLETFVSTNKDLIDSLIICLMLVVFSIFYFNPGAYIDQVSNNETVILKVSSVRATIRIIYIGIIYASIIFYYNPRFIFPYLPQFLGGGAPVCANLVVDSSVFSAEQIDVLKKSPIPPIFDGNIIYFKNADLLNSSEKSIIVLFRVTNDLRLSYDIARDRTLLKQQCQ